jgi:hypothetical protein
VLCGGGGGGRRSFDIDEKVLALSSVRRALHSQIPHRNELKVRRQRFSHPQLVPNRQCG